MSRFAVESGTDPCCVEPAGTRLWVATPEMLEAPPAFTLLDGFDEIHFVLSPAAPSGESISRWLDGLPDRIPYVEQDTDIWLHRYFTRRPAVN